MHPIRVANATLGIHRCVHSGTQGWCTVRGHDQRRRPRRSYPRNQRLGRLTVCIDAVSPAKQATAGLGDAHHCARAPGPLGTALRQRLLAVPHSSNLTRQPTRSRVHGGSGGAEVVGRVQRISVAKRDTADHPAIIT